ncbi:hypothetical protein JCM10213_006227 [Rhodosporidiobolus nylandii]
MPFRLPRLAVQAAAPPSYFQPSYRTVSAVLDASSASRRFSSSSNSGRSSSRDGSERAKSTRAPEFASPSSSRSASTVAPQRACAPPAPVAPRPTTLPASYVLPHASKELVGLDSFFAVHRPLLELPVKLVNRRSTRLPTAPVLPEETAELSVEAVLEAQGKTVKLEEDLGENLAKVVDLAEDGTPMGVPYIIRLDAPEPLKSVEEEMAAEAKEDAEHQQQVEMLHDQEAETVEPYDAWMIGQHQVQPAEVARYLAVHPPFTAPSDASSPSTSSAAAPSSIRSHLSFLSPFKPAVSASSPSPFPAFEDHFVHPLAPHEAGAHMDQFLSAAQMKLAWEARKDHVENVGEALRRAAQTYAGVEKQIQEQFPLPIEAAQRGSMRIWDEQDGWQTVQVARNDIGLNNSPFLPAEMVEIEDVIVSMDSVKRKRHKRMLKHKYKKRRKAQRALRQRLGK